MAQVPLCTLSGFGPSLVLYDLQHLREVWRQTLDEQFGELWLTKPTGETLGVLLNGSEAWLLYMAQPGEVGYSTRNPGYTGPPDAQREFMLNNGQRDTYPTARLISREEALRGAAYFAETGERAPWLTWHNDELPE